MSDFAIRVERLGKRYHLGRREAYRTLRESLVRGAGRLARAGRRSPDDPADEIHWALRDVSFTVPQGDAIAIIGRNGAGKSTLLKILSRIVEPTEGEIRLRGRVGSLLEVGTGFHPELSGRENIYLNGAILGMRKAEIASKFDAIVAFAEVERFLDTPVKRYSSGMYVRLAFAVAAHMETEVLLVDEVLAVGDTRFQKKCLGRMGEIGRQGRTVLFVSHSMAAVQSLCRRGIVLDGGRLDYDGPVESAVERYLRGDRLRASFVDLGDVAGRGGSGDVRITSFRIEDPSGQPSSAIPNGRACTFVLGYRAVDPTAKIDHVAATITVRNILGTRVFYHHNLLTGQPFDGVHGEGEFRLAIPRLPLAVGDYSADLHVTRDRGHTLMDSIEGQVTFEVEDGDFFGTGFEYKGGLNAAVLVDGSWEHRMAAARVVGAED